MWKRYGLLRDRLECEKMFENLSVFSYMAFTDVYFCFICSKFKFLG